MVPLHHSVEDMMLMHIATKTRLRSSTVQPIPPFYGNCADSFPGTLVSFDSAFAPPVRAVPTRDSDEAKSARRLHRQFVDARDRMEIPRADGSILIARELSDRLYDRHRRKLLARVRHEPRHATDPGTVLIDAIKQFARAVYQHADGATFDTVDLRALKDGLAGFRTISAVEDSRLLPLHALHDLVERLIDYYGV